MAFWTSAQGRDPKRKFRFLLTIDALPNGGQWFVKTSDRPSFEVASAEHKFLNHTFYYPGSVTWNEVSVTLVDPVDPDLQYSLANIIRGAGYYIPAAPADADANTTMSKSKAINALGGVTIEMIDSDGRALETWKLMGAWISSVENSNLEYGGDDLADTTIKFKYDWAELMSMGKTEVQYSVNTKHILPTDADKLNGDKPVGPLKPQPEPNNFN